MLGEYRPPQLGTGVTPPSNFDQNHRPSRHDTSVCIMEDTYTPQSLTEYVEGNVTTGLISVRSQPNETSSAIIHPATSQHLPGPASESINLGLKAISLVSHQPSIVSPEFVRTRKDHWDFVLQECNWLARDFYHERQWKVATAFKLSQEARVRIKEKETGDARHISQHLASVIGSYWIGIADQVCPQAISSSLTRCILALPSRQLIEESFDDKTPRRSPSSRQPEPLSHRKHLTPIYDDLLAHSITMMKVLCQLYQVKAANSAEELEELRFRKKRRVETLSGQWNEKNVAELSPTESEGEYDGLRDTDAVECEYSGASSLSYHLGSPLTGFGDYVQSRALEQLTDEIRESGYPIATELYYPSRSNASYQHFGRDPYQSLSTITTQWMSQLSQHHYEPNSIKDLAYDYMDMIKWPLNGSEPPTLEVPAEVIDHESCQYASLKTRSAKKEDCLLKASTIAQQQSSAVHPIILLGPHPVRDEPICNLSDPHPDIPSTDDVLTIAGYLHRCSDLIASYRGLKRRRQVASVLRHADVRAGLTTREPTSREIRAEVLNQIGQEWEMLGGRHNMSLSTLIGSIPTPIGTTSRRKLRAKVRDSSGTSIDVGSKAQSSSRDVYTQPREALQESDLRESHEMPPLIDPHISLYLPLHKIQLSNPDVDRRVGLKWHPKLGINMQQKGQTFMANWEDLEDITLDRLVHIYRVRSSKPPVLLNNPHPTQMAIIYKSGFECNWELIAKSLNQIFTPFNRHRTPTMCRQRWSYLGASSLERQLQKISEDFTTRSLGVRYQLQLQFGSSLLSTPDIILLPNHPPLPRASIAYNMPPVILTSNVFPIGSCHEIEQSSGQEYDYEDTVDDNEINNILSPSKAFKLSPNVTNVPWARLDIASADIGSFTFTVNPSLLQLPKLNKSKLSKRVDVLVGAASSLPMNLYQGSINGKSVQFFRDLLYGPVVAISRTDSIELPANLRNKEPKEQPIRGKRKRTTTQKQEILERTPSSETEDLPCHWPSNDVESLSLYFRFQNRKRRQFMWLQQGNDDSGFCSSESSLLDEDDDDLQRNDFEVDSDTPLIHSSYCPLVLSSLVQPPDRSILFLSEFKPPSQLFSVFGDQKSSSVEFSTVIEPLSSEIVNPYISPYIHSDQLLHDVSIFESMRQLPSPIQTRQLLPWILSSGAMLSVPMALNPKTTIACTSLWTIYGASVAPPIVNNFNMSWLGTVGLVNGQIGRKGVLTSAQSTPPLQLDDLLERDTKLMGMSTETAPAGPAQRGFSVLLTPVKRQTHLMPPSTTNSGASEDYLILEPSNVSEVYKAELHRMSSTSVKKAALTVVAGGVYPVSKCSARKAKELLKEWQREIFGLAAKTVAADLLVSLELYRLVSLLESYGLSMRRRAEVNCRAQSLFFNDQNLNQHIANVFSRTQQAPMTATAIMELLKMNNINLTTDLLPLHKGQIEMLKRSDTSTPTSIQMPFSQSRMNRALSELYRRVKEIQTLKSPVYGPGDFGHRQTNESVVESSFRTYLKDLGTLVPPNCRILDPKIIATTSSINENITKISPIANLIHRADETFDCLKFLYLSHNQLVSSIEGLPPHIAPPRMASSAHLMSQTTIAEQMLNQRQTNTWDILWRSKNINNLLHSFTFPRKLQPPESDLLDAQSRAQHLAPSAVIQHDVFSNSFSSTSRVPPAETNTGWSTIEKSIIQQRLSQQSSGYPMTVAGRPYSQHPPTAIMRPTRPANAMLLQQQHQSLSCVGPQESSQRPPAKTSVGQVMPGNQGQGPVQRLVVRPNTSNQRPSQVTQQQQYRQPPQPMINVATRPPPPSTTAPINIQQQGVPGSAVMTPSATQMFGQQNSRFATTQLQQQRNVPRSKASPITVQQVSTATLHHTPVGMWRSQQPPQQHTTSSSSSSSSTLSSAQPLMPPTSTSSSHQNLLSATQQQQLQFHGFSTHPMENSPLHQSFTQQRLNHTPPTSATTVSGATLISPSQERKPPPTSGGRSTTTSGNLTVLEDYSAAQQTHMIGHHDMAPSSSFQQPSHVTGIGSSATSNNQQFLGSAQTYQQQQQRITNAMTQQWMNAQRQFHQRIPSPYPPTQTSGDPSCLIRPASSPQQSGVVTPYHQQHSLQQDGRTTPSGYLTTQLPVWTQPQSDSISDAQQLQHQQQPRLMAQQQSPYRASSSEQWQRQRSATSPQPQQYQLGAAQWSQVGINQLQQTNIQMPRTPPPQQAQFLHHHTALLRTSLQNPQALQQQRVFTQQHYAQLQQQPQQLSNQQFLPGLPSVHSLTIQPPSQTLTPNNKQPLSSGNALNSDSLDPSQSEKQVKH